ncbi:hypothetical protein LR48_Vigan07g172400 [Vigna angularis]|uniref:Uncharacterized protein n=1 Tax=Phaseolus angularis TaxID=3914 RepID=A0A0L9UYU7_PHAAN|nr:hypothetical protein LR48_Vigan07g172400 [Vigna angularis]
MAEPSRRRRRRSYASASTPPARGPNIHGWITDDGRHEEYLQMWKERKVLRQKFVDLNWFTANQFQFSGQLVEQGVQHLLQLQGHYYPDLVRVLYYNLKAHNGIVYTRVKGVDIVLDHDIWTNVAHLPILENNLHVPNDFAKETLSVELVKYCYGDRGIAGSSLVYLRKCSEEEVILREVFGGSVSSFVKIQRRCWFISCGIKRGVF